MKKGFKIFLKAFGMICLITALLCGCTKMGTSRAPGDNAARLNQNGNRAQGLGRDDLAGNTTGLRQGNMYGTNMYGTNNNRTGQNMLQGANTGNGVTNGNGGANTQQTSFDTGKANRIKSRLTKMNGLTEANVLVSGDTCIVGYKSNSATGDTTALKDRITKEVKQADRTITNVLVSESSDIIERIKRMGAGNANGMKGNTNGMNGNANGLNRTNNGMTGNTNGLNRNNNGTTGNTVGNSMMDEFNDLIRSMTPTRR